MDKVSTVSNVFQALLAVTYTTAQSDTEVPETPAAEYAEVEVNVVASDDSLRLLDVVLGLEDEESDIFAGVNWEEILGDDASVEVVEVLSIKLLPGTSLVVL